MVYTLTVHLHCNDKPESIDRLKAKLIEASRIYRKDRETVDWIVMQDVHDPRSFTIVERFEQESVRIPPRTLLNSLHLTSGSPAPFERGFWSRGQKKKRKSNDFSTHLADDCSVS